MHSALVKQNITLSNTLDIIALSNALDMVGSGIFVFNVSTSYHGTT
jgi:hypothetical protein